VTIVFNVVADLQEDDHHEKVSKKAGFPGVAALSRVAFPLAEFADNW